MTQTYESLCQMLKKEIKTIEQQPALTKESLDLLKNITETMSNIKTIMLMEEEKESGISGMSNRGPYYYGNMSNAQRRDSMGRFMDYNSNSTMYNDMSMARGNSNDNSYARGNNYSRDDSRKKMVRKLETLMDDTMSEKERQAIQDCINRIDQ